MTFGYGTLTPANEKKVVEIQAKLRALEKLKAAIDIERQGKQAEWNTRLHEILTEENKLIDELRNLMPITVS